MAPARKTAKSGSVAKPKAETVPAEALRSAILCLAELIEQKKPILGALETCAKQQNTKSLATALMGVRRTIRAGTSLADALARYPEVFPAALCETVRTGESSGDVAAGMKKWAHNLASGEQETLELKQDEVEAFKRDLSNRVIQGATLVEALALSSYTSGNSQLAQIIRQVQEAVTGDGKSGATLAQAMARYPNVFDEAYINLWREIEEGKIDAVEALTRHASQYNQELMTLDQAVQFLGTSKPTLYRLLAQGELNGLKVGRQWRFRKADLVAHMERKPATVAATAAPEIDAELEFFRAETEKAGIPLREYEEEEIAAGELKIIQIVNAILSLAVEANASDIHIESMRRGSMVRLRVDGVLHVVREMPQSLFNPLIGRLKVMADLDVMERRVPQDGRIHIKYQEQDFDLRMSTCPNVFGESVVLRILLQTNALPGLEAIGWSPENRALVETLMHQPNGLVVFTGPTGSGKTTTMYSSLYLRLKPEIKTMTIEDPVEYILPYATQAGVNVKAGLSFTTALRSFLRQDPDIIMIGELRDLETTGIAVQAALTGHLVLTAMHSNDAVGALKRLVDVGIEPFLVASSAIGVISQRLVRMVCESCRQEYSPPRGLLERLGYTSKKYPRAKFTRGAGCSKCRFTGYRRRMAIQEILMMNEEISSLILSGASHEELQQAAERNGIVPLHEDGLRKCVQGLTTPEEVIRVAFSGP